MSESQIHMDIVNIVFNYISNMLPEGEKSSIQVDSSKSFCRPPRIYGNYQPDVYYIDTRKIIIGEAKTDTDCERKHSIEQYLSYIRECKIFRGDATIVIGVYFYGYDTMVNLFNILKARENYAGKVIILDSTGRIKQI